ncbi:AAA family ATPase [Nucisporomicrobium flavum]|uniref:AAA family ATPase n=1 Tax=Nucisporomicrobium flavum TaxID=2785915 RepID=UPI0027DBB771|nr:ATP-binding protein [Nucisporomicrobium flavum]
MQQYIHRLARRYTSRRPPLAAELLSLLRANPSRSAPLRGTTAAPAPVDLDSRLPLLRHDMAGPEVRPVLSETVGTQLRDLRDERLHRDRLLAAGLKPSRTALFVGPPGVGKTLASKWLADELSLPLLVLDLSAVMSSFLGRTGVNVRRVLDYAKSGPCVLLLDELDAVAKRRDDATEIGELKRLVTVLLQEIDDWPDSSLLLAATNHPDLLDPAVWRRFEHIVEFPLPDFDGIMASLQQLIGDEAQDASLLTALAICLAGSSYSDVERLVMTAKRKAAVADIDLVKTLEVIVEDRVKSLRKTDQIDIAIALSKTGTVSQRQTQRLTGVSRDTIRKRLNSDRAEA